MPDKLIIFDYSGTLSLEAVAFSRSDNLIRHLQKSGLFELGVNNTALFWEIINATWQKGSTTGVGYKAVLQEHIAELFPGKAIGNQRKISRATTNFVDDYFDNSRIDEHWRLILQKLSLDRTVDVIIATDHYAEATSAIIKHLGQWKIQAVPFATDAKSNFIVVNSADVGVHKAQQRFWQILKDTLGINFNHVLLIDDFGQNEQKSDDYADPVKINERRQMTIKILSAVFAVNVQSISFDLNDDKTSGLIAETSARIDQFLL